MHLLVDGLHLSHRAKGVGLYTRHVLERLAARDEDLRFTVVVLEEGGGPLPASCTAWSVPWRNHLWHGFVTLPRVVRECGAEGVFMPYDTAVGRLGVPYGMVCHDIPDELWRAQDSGGPRRSPLARLRDRLDSALWASGLRRAARVFCNSRWVAERLERDHGVAASRTRLAPCAPGADFEALSQRVEVARVRARLGAPEGYVLAIYTGDPRENPRVLAPVFDALVAAGLPHHLVVAGLRDEEREEMRSLLGGHRWFDERVHLEPFLGPSRRAELAALYTAAAVYFDPSLQEGFGMQVIEAMACGTPVVCSDRGALPEVTGGAARLVPADDPPAMASALKEVLRNGADLGERGRKRARHFDWDQTTTTIHRGLRSMLGHDSGDGDG
jgi:glycosyltransferase involved in cell wall biosynthesis